MPIIDEIVIKIIFFTTTKLVFNYDTIYCYWNVVRSKIIIILFSILILATGCQTIKNKSDAVAERENEKFGQFIGKQVTELKIVMGNPDKETKDEKGSKILIYKTKKYSIACERKFEINEVNMVVGFSSKGCF